MCKNWAEKAGVVYSVYTSGVLKIELYVLIQ